MDDIMQFKNLGVVGVFPLIAYGLYKVWLMLKDDKRTDTNNNRMDTFYGKLQDQVGLMGTRIDDLQKIRENLVNENANFSAQLTVAKAQIEQLREQVTQAADREKYLQDLLTKNGIAYNV